CTLVPDPPGVLTSNAGWKLDSGNEFLRDVLTHLRENGIRSSLFLEPDVKEVKRAKQFGADRIELYTGPYAQDFGPPLAKGIVAAHRQAARVARAEGLGVNAGHDLNLKNIPPYVRAVRSLAETSIGHALVNDALYIGLTKAVKAYLAALGSTPQRAAAKKKT